MRFWWGFKLYENPITKPASSSKAICPHSPPAVGVPACSLGLSQRDACRRGCPNRIGLWILGILAFLCLPLTSLPSSFQQNHCHCIRNILKFQGTSSKHVLWSVVNQHMCFVWPSLNLKSLKFVHNMKKSGAHHKSLDFGFSWKIRCGNRWSTFPHGGKWPELNSGCPFECNTCNPQHCLLLPSPTSFICTVCLASEGIWVHNL